jgi:hypothetical protein
MSRRQLIEMFTEMVIKKNAHAVSTYYHPEFLMISNGVTQDYEAFRASHEGVYDTDISYSVEYDDEAWVEQADRVAGRVWITPARPEEQPTRIEVMLIALFRENRIFRLWELTWPNWSDLPAFEHYEG